MVAAPPGKPPHGTVFTVHEMPVALGGRARRVAWFGLGAVGLLVLAFFAAQLVPYGRTHSNPPVVQEPAWDSSQTRTLFARACNDCHSNRTEWSRQSTVAPLSWLTQWAIDEGRTAFNVSEWPSGGRKAGNVAGSVEKGQMPPEVYLSLNPDERLTPGEQQALIRGLRATFGDRRGGSVP
jgi:mono/diheme cytochrome c family protein